MRAEITRRLHESRLDESEIPVAAQRVAKGRAVGETAAVAGYSGTPLPKKLGIRAGSRLALVAAPESFTPLLEPMPDGVRLMHAARGRHDVIVFFATRRNELTRRFAKLANALEPDGGLWIAWPKRTARVATDLTESVVREIGLSGGLVDNKVCAVDDCWSGLRFVHRVADRPDAGATAKPATGTTDRARANGARH